ATNRLDGSNGHPTRKQRVLLTNAYGPYELKWGTAPSDLLGARLARGHEMLAMGSRLPTWALYLIAENLTNPCTVLEYPRWDDFVRELGEGYDVVAIELKSIHTRRVVQMMKAIREHSPGTRIVIGGYGVGALRDGMPGDTEELAKHILEDADLICRGEGVRTMRQYLGDAPYDRPITQYHLPPATVRPYQGEARLEIRLPSILVSLGCPSACDFCNTSAFFHHKKTYMASPAQVYDFMKNYQRRLGEDRITFILFDEDIFLDAEYVRELGRLIRSDPKTWGFRWISFGSVKALEQFTPRELRECGVEGIWIGVESGLVDHGTEKLGYSKRGAQDPVALFEQLRNHGIQTIGSMILGLDFHTPDNIEQDIDYFVSLKPTFYQIGPIRPCPGTKLYRQMRKQGRITQDYDWEHFHLWEETSHKPKHFEQGGIRKYYDLAHERLKTVLGSPVLQIYEANLLAYETFKDADTAFLRYQAEVSLDSVRRLHPVVRGLEVNPESPAVLRRTRALIARAEPHLHQDGLAARVFRRVAGRVVGWRMSVPSEAATPAGLYAPDTAWARYDDDGSGGPRVKTASAAPPRPLDEVERGERARRTNVVRRVRSLVVGSETSI
ncbi:MAG: B12-binding domain-containing radical SAM protein, partial [Myxococcota bacterium]